MRQSLVLIILAGTAFAARAVVDTTGFFPSPPPGLARLSIFDDMSRQLLRESGEPGVQFVDTLDEFERVLKRQAFRRHKEGTYCTATTCFLDSVEEVPAEGEFLLLPNPMLERKKHRVKAELALRGVGPRAGQSGEGRLKYRARIRRREAVDCPALGGIYAYRVDFLVRVKGRLGEEKYRRKAKWSAWFSTLDGMVVWRDRSVTKVLVTTAIIEE